MRNFPASDAPPKTAFTVTADGAPVDIGAAIVTRTTDVTDWLPSPPPSSRARRSSSPTRTPIPAATTRRASSRTRRQRRGELHHGPERRPRGRQQLDRSPRRPRQGAEPGGRARRRHQHRADLGPAGRQRRPGHRELPDRGLRGRRPPRLAGAGGRARHDEGRRDRAALRASRAGSGHHPPLPGPGEERGRRRRLVGLRRRHDHLRRPRRPDRADGDAGAAVAARRHDADPARLGRAYACAGGRFADHRLPDRGLRDRRPAGLGGAGGRHREPEPDLPAHRASLGGDPPLPGLRDQRRRHEPGLGGRQRQDPRHPGAGAAVGDACPRTGTQDHDRLQRDARRDGGEPAGGRAFHGPGR